MLEELRKYEKLNLVTHQNHPTLPLSIWNYTKHCQFERYWDEVTIIARGLILNNDTGEIVGRSFPKFFNLEEEKHTPTNDFQVFDKLDGSLIIIFFYEGEWIVASRGSFDSIYSQGADRLFKQMNVGSGMDPKYSYCFELMTPFNRVVINYGDEEKISLLAGIRISDGKDLPYEELKKTSQLLGCDLVKRYDGIKDYRTLKDKIGDDQEGFVILFSNGERIKIKGEQYIRLHRILSGLTTRSIYECFVHRMDISVILEDVPDEIYQEITLFYEGLIDQYWDISERMKKIYYENYDPNEETRNFVERIKSNYDKDIFACVMAIYNNFRIHQFDNKILKMIEPKFRPF